jgi:hypothetical protein
MPSDWALKRKPVPKAAAKIAKCEHGARVSVALDPPCLQGFQGSYRVCVRRLKIVVSPVRVRVSPSENRLLQSGFSFSGAPPGRVIESESTSRLSLVSQSKAVSAPCRSTSTRAQTPAGVLALAAAKRQDATATLSTDGART